MTTILELQRVETPAAIIYEHWPPVYKYRAFDRNAISILVDRELYFASPDALNDPHDSQFEISSALLEAAIEYQSRNPPPDRATAIREAIDKLRGDEGFRNRIESAARAQAICSMSMHRDNSLMWAHYADSHRGVCFGFDPRKVKEKIGSADNVLTQYVTYTDGNPFIPVLHAFSTAAYSASDGRPPSFSMGFLWAISAAVSTKSLAWAHEGEMRFLRATGGASAVSFRPDALREVLIGCRMPLRDRNTLTNLLSLPKWKHVRLFELRKSPSRLGFETVEVKGF